MKSPTILLAAGIHGATGVALGAFGAHALRAFLTENGTRDRWETAVLYQFVHALALLGAGIWMRSAGATASRRLGWAARFWIYGTVLFCGSLYVLAIFPGAPLWFKIPVPPLGGIAFVVGWLCLTAAALAKEE